LEPIKETHRKSGRDSSEKEATKNNHREINKIIIEKETNRIIVSEKILFEPEKPDVLKTSVDTLRELSEFILEEIKDKKIRIEVHTDPVRDEKFDRD